MDGEPSGHVFAGLPNGPGYQNRFATQYDMTTDLPEQPRPENAHCPQCGSPATDESIRDHRLSDLGYMHDDISFQCTECDNSWVHGVPIGSDESGYGDDLWCQSCDAEYYRVHRVTVQKSSVRLDLKCPRCFHFTTTNRDRDEHNRALVGFPDITGDRTGAAPYGWTDDDDD